MWTKEDLECHNADAKRDEDLLAAAQAERCKEIRALCDRHGIGSALRPDGAGGVVLIDLGPKGQTARTLQEAERVLKLYGRL